MSYTVLNVDGVRSDIIDAIEYYSTINPVLAKQFIMRVREAKNYLSASPLVFEIKYKEVRTLLLKQFPYHIHYIVDESNEQVIVLAIIHAYKNPRDYSIRG
jgi:plasmid stabilization system protein ParE